MATKTVTRKIISTFNKGDSVYIEYAGNDVIHISFSRDDYCGKRFLTNVSYLTVYDSNFVYWKFDSAYYMTNDLSVKSCRMILTEKIN